MNQHRDPFELLRALNPIDPEELRDAAFSPRAHEALERILAEERRARHRQRRAFRIPRWRHRTLILALLPVAALLATAAWALTQGASKHLTVGCYGAVDLQARTIVIPAEERSAVAACDAVWERGDFGAPAPPRLEACVLPSGAIGVFPSPDGTACEQLGLSPLTAPPARGPTPRPPSPTALKNALVERFADRCLNEREATSIARNELNRLRLASWRVETNGTFTADRPCASLAFDEENRLVLLVPLPK